MMLLPLIKSPRNARSRKEAKKRLAAAEAIYGEVQRLGSMIHELEQLREKFVHQLALTRWGVVDLQAKLASELNDAGYPMEGTVKRPFRGDDRDENGNLTTLMEHRRPVYER